MSEGRKYSETCRYGRVRLMKRTTTGIWYMKYRLGDGKYKEESTGTACKSDAMTQAETRSSQVNSKVLRIADGKMPIRELFRIFLEAKEGRRKPRSVARLETTIRTFQSWLLAYMPHVRLTRHLSPEVIRSFQQHRADSGQVAMRTVNDDVKNLHTAFRWAVRECIILRSPADYSRNGNVDLYEEEHNDRDTYTEGEYLALLKEADSQGMPLVRDIIVVLAGTGMRFQELAHMTAKWVHWETCPPYIQIRADNGWSPKDPREIKQVPMSPEVAEVIRRRFQNAGDGYLFANQAGKPVLVNRTRDRLQRLFPAVGIDRTKRRLHWHSFRNYFITRCLARGAMLHDVMKWTGHDSVQMVLHYAKVVALEANLAAFQRMVENGDKVGNSEPSIPQLPANTVVTTAENGVSDGTRTRDL